VPCIHLEAYTALSDSLHRVRYDEQLARSEALYGNAKNERVIAEQEQLFAACRSMEERTETQAAEPGPGAWPQRWCW
jgi:hypothetical protein